jgi:hypothetical protein
MKKQDSGKEDKMTRVNSEHTRVAVDACGSRVQSGHATSWTVGAENGAFAGRIFASKTGRTVESAGKALDLALGALQLQDVVVFIEEIVQTLT